MSAEGKSGQYRVNRENHGSVNTEHMNSCPFDLCQTTQKEKKCIEVFYFFSGFIFPDFFFSGFSLFWIYFFPDFYFPDFLFSDFTFPDFFVSGFLFSGSIDIFKKTLLNKYRSSLRLA